MDKFDIKEYIMKPVIKAGYHIWFVGGCVRDKLMGMDPHDFDLATDATPEQLHKIFDKFSDQNSEPFGVTMPIVKGELVEIATLRKDITKGRHPSVVFTNAIEEDARRRDFTVNAMYEDIDGNIIDFAGGKDDVVLGRLRFVGDPLERVKEDPLRLFRFCRFMAQKGFSNAIDLTDFLKIVEFVRATPDLFAEVSKERKLKELIGILGGKYFMKGDDTILNVMGSFGVLGALGLDRIFEDMKETAQNPKWHSEGSVLNHTILVMKEMAKHEHDWLDMMAAMLHDIGKPISAARGIKKNPDDTWYVVKDHAETGALAAEGFCKGLGMCKDDVAVIKTLVAEHMHMHRLSELHKFQAWQYTSHPLFDRMVKLCRCDTNGALPLEPDEWLKIDETLELPMFQEILGKPMPKPIITGDDLVAAGIKPSKHFKKALDTAWKVQLEQGETDKRKLLNNIINIARGK